MLPLDPAAPFAAIDFETADYQSDSACAVSLLRVEGLQIVSRRTRLIRPPRQHIVFTYIHGITWQHVKAAPTFGEIWPELNQLLDGVAFVAAHNAGFDRNVLQRCCQAAALTCPPQPFLCTVQLARRTWRLKSAKLPDVCAHLGLKLRHHDPESDAEACRRIVIAAMQARNAALGTRN